MDLITGLEIGYFRSIYKASIRELKDLNIFSGKNDTGKSNILKALNLFFNGQAEWETRFDFAKDFSKVRETECEKGGEAKRKYVYVKVFFRKPKAFAALPDTFYVKKQWNSYGGQAVIEDKNIEGSGPKQSLEKLLKKIKFEYIPAIRDKYFYKYLLNKLQETLLEEALEKDPDIGKNIEKLNERISRETGLITDDFLEATRIESNIYFPTTAPDIFQSFLVDTELGDGVRIPLALRGDGIQARYLAALLYFISEKSNNIYVWGFEEPENSVELGLVSALAKDFENTYCITNQIFITTHSPAFFCLDSSNIKTFRVFKKGKNSEITHVDQETLFGGVKELEEDIGLFRIQRDLHEKYLKGLVASKELEKVNKILYEAGKTTVFTEGETDEYYLQYAWRALRPSEEFPFRIRSCNTLEGITADPDAGFGRLKSLLESTLPKDPARIGIFDRDKDGIKAFNKLNKNFLKWKDNENVRVHKNEKAFAIILPFPPELERFAKSKNLIIEYFFPDEYLTQSYEGKALEISGAKRTIDRHGAVVEESLSDEPQYRELRGDKGTFAEKIVPQLRRSAFENFRPLVDLLAEVRDYIRSAG